MISIDGREIEAAGALLDACRAAGAEVSALCHDGRLSPGGHCGSCVVEADGRLVRACSTPAREVRDVTTDSPRLRAYRRDLGELMLAESSPRGDAGEWIRAQGADGERYTSRRRPPQIDQSHPYLRIDLERCIRCRLCERACAEIQGSSCTGSWGAARAPGSAGEPSGSSTAIV